MATSTEEVQPTTEEKKEDTPAAETTSNPTNINEDVLSIPWQDLDGGEWSNEFFEDLATEIENYSPLKERGVSRDKIPYVNILLMGRISSGKSSFFNTIDSVVKGRLSVRARAGCANSSLTKSLDVYKVKSRGRTLNFRLYDCRGLEEDNSVQSRDVEAILDGHMMDGYMFNQGAHITKDSPKYRRDPSIADCIHCVLFVVDGSNPPEITMSQNVKQQVMELQEIMNRKRIPQLILLTKVDSTSSVKNDLSKVFQSKTILDMRDKVAMSFGLPSYSVLPTQNLADNRNVTKNIKILTLYNLRQALRAADDYLENFEEELMPDSHTFNSKQMHGAQVNLD